MSHQQSDRELGMGRNITRRDFLNGVAMGIGVLGTAGFGGMAKAGDEAPNTAILRLILPH